MFKIDFSDPNNSMPKLGCFVASLVVFKVLGLPNDDVRLLIGGAVVYMVIENLVDFYHKE